MTCQWVLEIKLGLKSVQLNASSDFMYLTFLYEKSKQQLVLITHVLRSEPSKVERAADTLRAPQRRHGLQTIRKAHTPED